MLPQHHFSTEFIGLARRIELYYYAHLDGLDDAKKFHFASRLAAWKGGKRAYDTLSSLKMHMIPSTREDAVRDMLQDLLHTPQVGKRIAHELRIPLFQKYPELYGFELAIFRVRHLKYVYGIDITEQLFNLYEKSSINQLKDRLLADYNAIKYLSSFAVNFCYLTDIVINGQKPTFDIENIYKIGTTYDLKNKFHIQLLLYLYTHCIIAETNFYIQHITQQQAVYLKMLAYAESVIANNFQDISLDNKLEFLVCTRICGVTSSIENLIHQECLGSVSDQGEFVIDKLNNNIRDDRQVFDKSEHRNVLLIMSGAPFVPHNKILT